MCLVKLFIVNDTKVEMNWYLVFLLSVIKETKIATAWDQTIEYQQ